MVRVGARTFGFPLAVSRVLIPEEEEDDEVAPGRLEARCVFPQLPLAMSVVLAALLAASFFLCKRFPWLA